LVSWLSHKQKVVSRSSTEAEYRSVAAALADITWLQSLFTELRFPGSIPKIYCDNSGVVLLASNPVLHSKTKHFELDHFFVRDRVQQQRLSVVHLPSQDQIVDLLTKPVFGAMFLKFRSKLMVEPISTISLRGDIKK